MLLNYIYQVLTFSLMLIFSLSVNAASEIINYSGRLVQPSGAPVSGSVNLDVKVYENATEKCSVSVTGVTLVNGVFNTALEFENQCNAGADSLSDVVKAASGADLWIEVTDASSGVTYPKQSLTAVPFALTSLTSTAAPASISFGALNEDGSCDHTQNQYHCVVFVTQDQARESGHLA